MVHNRRLFTCRHLKILWASLLRFASMDDTLPPPSVLETSFQSTLQSYSSSTKIPKAVLDIIGKRAIPRQWAQYSIASYTIKAYNKGTTPLSKKLKQMGYINDRCPKRARYFDASRLKIGRQDLSNHLDFLNLKFNWIGDFSDDYIRTKLKKEFFII